MAEPLLKRTLSRFRTKTEPRPRDVPSAPSLSATPSSAPPSHLRQTWTNQSPVPAPSSQNAPGQSSSWSSPGPGLGPGPALSRTPDPSSLWAFRSGSDPVPVWVPRSPGLRAYLQSLDSSSRAWVLSSGKSPAPDQAWVRPSVQGEEQIWYNPIPEEEEELQGRGAGSEDSGAGLGLEEQTGVVLDTEEKTETKLSLETPEHSGGVSERMIDKLRSPATKLRRKLSLKSRRDRHGHTNQDTPPANQESSSPSRKRPIRRQNSGRRGYHSDGDSPELLPRQQLTSQKEEESHDRSPAHSLTGILTVHLQGLDHMTHRSGVSRCVSVVIQVDDVIRARTAAMTMTSPTLRLNHAFNIQLEHAQHLKIIILTRVSPDPEVKTCARTRLCAVGGVSLTSVFSASRSQALSLGLEPRGSLHLRLSLQAGEEAVGGAPGSVGGVQVFGVDLRVLVQRESSEKPVPLIIQKTVSEINRRGLKVEGLYRLCGSSSLKKQLRDWFETNSSSVDLRDCPDLHAITGVLKDYLRELPSALITPSLYEAVKEVMTLQPLTSDPWLTSDPCCVTPEPELFQRTVQLLHCLPPTQKATLSFLLDHLSLVASCSLWNKMTAQNLAVCFGPVLFAAVQTDQWDRGAAVRGGARAKGGCHVDQSGNGVDFKQHLEALHFLLQTWPVPRRVPEQEVGGATLSSPEHRYRPRDRDRYRHRQAGDWSQYQDQDQDQDQEPTRETDRAGEESVLDLEAPFSCRLSLKDFDLLIQDFHRQLSSSVCL